MTMPPLRRFRAPEGDGELLVDPAFDRIPELISRNRHLLDTAEVRIDGTPLSQFRRETRQELSVSIGPLILTGHQPELCHPGVWLKTFAAAGLAERLNGTALNLVVDADEVKVDLRCKVPVWDADPSRVRSVSVAFDSGPVDVAYESRPIHDEPFFASFPRTVGRRCRERGPSIRSSAKSGKSLVDAIPAHSANGSWRCVRASKDIVRLPRADVERESR